MVIEHNKRLYEEVPEYQGWFVPLGMTDNAKKRNITFRDFEYAFYQLSILGFWCLVAYKMIYAIFVAG